jgi:tripartite-type tricarboxylate transporter receptor subunit TctC
LPDVPTVAEAMPGFEASVWYALLAPANTPQDIIAKLNGATNTFLGSQQTKDMFHDLGIVASGGSPEEASSFIAAEIQKWAPIIKAANITF